MNFSVIPTNLLSKAKKIDVIICNALSYSLLISAWGSKNVYTKVFNLSGHLRFNLDRKYINDDLQFKFALQSVQGNLWMFFMESMKAIIKKFLVLQSPPSSSCRRLGGPSDPHGKKAKKIWLPKLKFSVTQKDIWQKSLFALIENGQKFWSPFSHFSKQIFMSRSQKQEHLPLVTYLF